MSNHVALCDALCPACRRKAEGYFRRMAERRSAGRRRHAQELEQIRQKVADVREALGCDSIPEFRDVLRVPKRKIAQALDMRGRRKWQARRRFRILNALRAGTSRQDIAQMVHEYPCRLNKIIAWGVRNKIIKLDEHGEVIPDR